MQSCTPQELAHISKAGEINTIVLERHLLLELWERISSVQRLRWSHLPKVRACLPCLHRASSLPVHSLITPHCTKTAIPIARAISQDLATQLLGPGTFVSQSALFHTFFHKPPPDIRSFACDTTTLWASRPRDTCVSQNYTVYCA